MAFTKEKNSEFEFLKPRIQREWEAGCAVNDRLIEMMESRNNAPLSAIEIETMLDWREAAVTASLSNEQAAEMPIAIVTKPYLKIWKITVVWFDLWADKYGLAIEWGERKALFQIWF